MRKGMCTRAACRNLARRARQRDVRPVRGVRSRPARPTPAVRTTSPLWPRARCRHRRRRRVEIRMSTDAYVRDADEIYRQSFAIIRAEADLSRIPADLEPAAVRMIHACGMVDLVDDLAWSDGVGT